jgi:hypothetical protein
MEARTTNQTRFVESNCHELPHLPPVPGGGLSHDRVLARPAGTSLLPRRPPGKPVVNADQTVIIIWDADSKTEHFIRQASFKSGADDFGFLIPTPAQPELEESGNDAFPYLLKLTEPEIIKATRPALGMNCGCSSGSMPSKASRNALPTDSVTILAEKLVAGFNATVLETKSTNSLVQWLKEHGYGFSPEVAQWAKPYIDGGWKITALKIAKDQKVRPIRP